MFLKLTNLTLWEYGLQSPLKISWRCHQLLSAFLGKGHLPRVSYQSRLSADERGNNEMIPGAVHRSPGICLTVEENPGNPQLGDRLMKAVRSVIA